LFVDESPLIFFHIHRFQQINRWLVYIGLRVPQQSAVATVLHLNGLLHQRHLRAAAALMRGALSSLSVVSSSVNRSRSYECCWNMKQP
jgi:hypothetical protein